MEKQLWKDADREVERLRGELILQKDLNLDAMQRLQEKDELIAELRQEPSWLDRVAVKIAAGKVAGDPCSMPPEDWIATYSYDAAEALIEEGKRRAGK